MVDATDASAMLKALKDARKALHTIANLSEGGCARYVAKAKLFQEYKSHM